MISSERDNLPSNTLRIKKAKNNNSFNKTFAFGKDILKENDDIFQIKLNNSLKGLNGSENNYQNGNVILYNKKKDYPSKKNNKELQRKKIIKKCYECDKILDESIEEIHKNHKDHIILEYIEDKMNFECQSHKKNFSSYCKNCQKNLCDSCKKKHDKSHTLFQFNYFSKLYKNIDKFKNFIKTKINQLTEIDKLIEEYDKINEEINRDPINYYKLLKDYEDINNHNKEAIKLINEIKKIWIIEKETDKLKVIYDKLKFINNKITKDIDNNNDNLINSTESLNSSSNDRTLVSNSSNNDEITIKIKFKKLEKNKKIKEIRIFGDKFFDKNKNCKMLIKKEEEQNSAISQGATLEVNENRIDERLINKMLYLTNLDIERKIIITLKEINNINDLSYMFSDCDNISELEININNLSITNISNMFMNCSSLEKIRINNLNTSNISDMSMTFANCKELNKLPNNISDWDTSKVLNMNYLFFNCTKLEKIPDLSNWDISNLTEMSGIFANCESLKKLPNISEWETSNVIKMNSLFSGCKSLESLSEISKWDFSNLEDMSYMFNECNNLKDISFISDMDTSNVKKMNNLFANCCSLETFPKFESSKTTNVTDISFMFFNCNKLKLPESESDIKFEFNKEKISDMSYLFYNCKLLNSNAFSKYFFKNDDDYKKVDKNEIFGSNGCILF